MGQVPPCSGIRRSISCLFWSTTLAKLCWLFRAVLRNLFPRNLISGVFLRMALICSPEYPKISQGPTGVLNVLLFCFLPWLDSWVVNTGIMSWYTDCYGGRKYYRVGALPRGLELSLWGPIFQTLIRTSVPGTFSSVSLESFGSWLILHKRISCWYCPIAIV